MWKYIVPCIPMADIPATLKMVASGAVIAGCYGVLHDQITFSIGPEYFYNLKFHQFAYANPGLGDRVFAGCIGFLATWWVGAIVGWVLARRFIPNRSRTEAFRLIRTGFAVVFISGFTAGLAGFLYGTYRGPDADYSHWQNAFRVFGITDHWAFVRVAYIHNASYSGGLIGLLIAMFTISRRHSGSDILAEEPRH